MPEFNITVLRKTEGGFFVFDDNDIGYENRTAKATRDYTEQILSTEAAE